MRRILSLAAVAALSSLAVAQATVGVGPEPRTAAAVRAADDAWGAAEARGDAGFVDELLLPGYQSVGPTGQATTKAQIVAGARKRAGDTAAAARIADWKAKHPLRSEVALYGDTAVLTWISTKPGAGEPVSSCDVFSYRDGRWRPAYSQHSQLE